MANKVFLIEGAPGHGLGRLLVEAVSEKEALKLWASQVAKVTKLSPADVLRHANLPQLSQPRESDSEPTAP